MKIITAAARSSHRRRYSALSLVVVAAIAGLLLVRWVNAQVRPVEDWTSQPPNAAKGVPTGWKKLPDVLPFVQRQVMLALPANYDFEIVPNGAGRALHLKSAGDHSIIVKELTGLDLTATPVLEWMWRVDVLPQGANLNKNDQSDSAAEIHLVWKASKRTMGYAWDETWPVESNFENPRRREVHFLVVTTGKARPREWISVTRNVVSDHRTLYGTDPSGPPDQIAISVDSNQTHSTAESFIGAIRFRAP
jgi:hypothetical protein